MVRLKSLYKYLAILVSAFGAADNLCDQFKDALFGRVVGKGESCVGAGDAKSGELGKIKALGDYLGANNYVKIAGTNGGVEVLEFGASDVVGVEAGDFGVGEKATEFVFDLLRAKAFMVNAGVVAVGAGRGYGKVTTAAVAVHFKEVVVEDKGEKTVWTKRLPTALVADSERSSAAAVVEDKALSVTIKGLGDTFEKWVAKDGATGKEGAVFEVDERNRGKDIRLDGELTKRDDSVVFFTEVIVGDEWRGGAKQGTPHDGGETGGKVFGVLVLVVAWFVRFIDNDEAEVLYGGKEGRAGANDDFWLGVVEDIFPDLVAQGLALGGVNKIEVLKMGRKIIDELGSEGDFGNKKDERLFLREEALREVEVDVGLATTGDAVEKDGVRGVIFYGLEGATLIII